MDKFIKMSKIVNLLAEIGETEDAKRYLQKMKAQVDAINGAVPILKELPLEETTEPLRTDRMEKPVVTSSTGAIRDAGGKILAISTQPDGYGYDPNAHELEIKIYCNGQHIENAHTADVLRGVVWEWRKTEKGRIESAELTGSVEIHGK
jgi:hypothetical protein